MVSPISRRWKVIPPFLASLFCLALALAWIANRFSSLAGWTSFMGGLLIATGLLLAGWYLINRDRQISPPAWLFWLVAGAAILRLAMGAFWFVALPVFGYSSGVEDQGYIMADAQSRDRNAWFLADSSKPLWTAVRDLRQVDQYVGMLFISAAVYRYAGAGFHQPLLIVVITAAVSALTVLFTWAMARRAWGPPQAAVAAVVTTIFPEAVLLGSSQMREAFLMAFVAATAYGIIRYWQDRSWGGLFWALAGLVLVIPFSPPVAALLLIMVIVLSFAMQGRKLLRQPVFWLVVAGLILLAGLGIWLAWDRIAPPGVSNPLALLGWWFKDVVRWQTYFVRRSSRMVKAVLRATPDWSHVLILMTFGTAQPFLPAAVLDNGLPIWRFIAIWRALGWTIMLAFLLLAPFLAARKGNGRSLLAGLIGLVWFGILLSALRAGGDIWDNPRYRTVFVSLEAAVFAWTWVEYRTKRGAWPRRIFTSLGLIMFWFVPWYLQRYTTFRWPIESIFVTIGLGLASIVIFLIIEFFRQRRVATPDSSWGDPPE